MDASLGGGLRLLTGPRTAICHECVALCVEIFDDTEERDTRAESLQRWVRHLSSPDPFLRCLAAVGLGDRGLANDPAAREALLGALADTDWRVRAFAEATLSNAGALPDGYRPSFVGRLRSLDFLEVFFAEDPNAIERDTPVVDSL
jgi:ClpX C4-type zinc finger